MQDLANALGLPLYLSDFPPGTSKWDKNEHRLFSFVPQNWHGKPLRSLRTIVNLMSRTRTKAGLTVQARLDTRRYETGIRVSGEELARLRLYPAKFHGEWNCTVRPRRS